MEETNKSSLGIEESLAAALCYAVMFFSGVFFLLVEKKSRLVKFHAFQATITMFVIFLAVIISAFIPFYGIFIAIFVLFLNMILLLLLIYKALMSEPYQLPLVGPLAERWAYRE